MLYLFFIAFLKIGSVFGSICDSFFRKRIPKTKIKNVDLTTFYQGMQKNAKECKGIMEPVGVEPTSKHLPTYLSTTIGYVLV